MSVSHPVPHLVGYFGQHEFILTYNYVSFSPRWLLWQHEFILTSNYVCTSPCWLLLEGH